MTTWKKIILIILLFMGGASSYSEETCSKVLLFQGLSKELGSFEMDLQFCKFKKSSREVVSHITYIDGKTKTKIVKMPKYKRIRKALAKLSKELRARKYTTKDKKCQNASLVSIKTKQFYLCEESADSFFIRKIKDILGDIYFSK